MKSAARKLAYSLLNTIQRSGFFPGRVRTKIVRLLGHDLSEETFISQQVFFSGRRLKTEGMVSINSGCHINADGDIHIDSGVRIGCRVILITSTHKIGPPELRAGYTVYLPIRIGRGSWIGAGAVILPGVSVAPGCIIAAGAVVTGDTEANGLYAGVPARRMKTLDDPASGSPQGLGRGFLEPEWQHPNEQSAPDDRTREARTYARSMTPA